MRQSAPLALPGYLRVPLQLAFQEGALAKSASQQGGIDSERGSFRLDHRPGVAGVKSRYQRDSREAVLAHQTDFHALPIRHDAQDGEQARVTEIT